MRSVAIIVFFLMVGMVSSFVVRANNQIHSCIAIATALFSEATETQDAATTIEPKEAVKLFGRLAEKYIMLDPTGGMCCYSGCSDCEYRLPDGGYRMADQSASRPKWIPSYDFRSFESSGKEHAAKWATDIFIEGPAVTRDEFVTRLMDSTYAPPLGGPYVSASAGAKFEDTTAASALFDILTSKEKLTKHSMGKRIKELAGGQEGLTWASFQSAVCG